MRKAVIGIYDFLNRRRWMVWISLVIITAGCVCSALSLDFEEDIYEFLPKTDETERYTFVTEHYRIANEIVVNIAMKDKAAETDTELLEAIIDELSDSLNNSVISKHISKITSTVDSRNVSSISSATASLLPYYLDSCDYASIAEKITPDAIREQLEYDRFLLGGASGAMMKKVLMTDPLFLSSDKLKGLSGFKYSENYQLIDGYIFTSDSKEAVVTIESTYPSSETKGNKALISELDRLCQDMESRYEEISISPFGAAYVAISNADRIKKDSTIAIAAAVLLILLILGRAYRSIRVIAALGATLLFGIIFSLGICGLCNDTVSIIAIGMGSIIIGIAANYPLHFIDHRYQGYDNKRTILDISKPLTIGNITTVGAFFSLLFISSPAMHDLGLFASMILIGTILFVLIYLPHILRLKPSAEPLEEQLIFSGIGRLHPERNKWIILSVLILTAVFAVTGKDTGFNADMNRINYMTSEQRERMAALTAQQNSSNEILYVFSDSETLDGALEAYERTFPILGRMVSDSLIVSVSGISGYLPSRKLQNERICMWNTFWKDRGESTADMVDEYSLQSGFKEGVFNGFRALVNTVYEPVDIEKFGPIKSILADNYIISSDDRYMILTPLQIKRENIETVRTRLSEELDSDSFCFSQGSMVGEVVDHLSDDFDLVLWICSILVFIFLLITFRSAELSIIAFIPLAVSWIWILGIMGIFGMEFNIINIILATFIFGMGDDYTIFITEGCMEEYKTGRKILDTFKNTVMLSAIIVFAGIGVLVFAKHPSLNQLGLVTIIGMVCVVTMAYIIPPFFFRILTYKKGRKRSYPITLVNLGKTVFIFFFMMISTTFLAVEGFILLTVMGRTKHHKKLYHKTIWHLSRFAVNHIPGTTFRMNDVPVQGNPTVLISNHQSHLDLMAILSISPDIVVLTNQWVQRFPFYAPLVRYADFLGVEGIASGNTLNALKELVADGYSVAIFPEGTRSDNGEIGRFHKGAFVIAQALCLDIQPAVLHGFSDTLPKADLLLRKGRLSMTFLPTIPFHRIHAAALTSATGMLELAKDVRQQMTDALNTIRMEYENASYFGDKAAALYTYKGEKLLHNVKTRLKSTDCFSDTVDNLPYTGTVVLDEPHLGEMTLIAGWARPQLHIVSNVSFECHEILSNLASLPDNVTLRTEK